jgi:hypothetical protein
MRLVSLVLLMRLVSIVVVPGCPAQRGGSPLLTPPGFESGFEVWLRSQTHEIIADRGPTIVDRCLLLDTQPAIGYTFLNRNTHPILTQDNQKVGASWVWLRLVSFLLKHGRDMPRRGPIGCFCSWPHALFTRKSRSSPSSTSRM